MVRIPDHWPPDEDRRPSLEVTVPVFPLPEVFLFPGQVLPLHIFEPRYRQMIEDSLDGPGRIAIACAEDEVEAGDADTPPLRKIAGLGEIARHDKLPDGRFLIWLGGVARVRIEEVPSDRMYRRVRCELADEIPPSHDRAADLRQPLMEAISRRVDNDLELGEDLPIGLLTDLLSQCIPMPTTELGELFEEPDIERRAQRALSADKSYPEADDEGPSK